MEKPKRKCPLCGMIIGVNAYSVHLKSHDNHPPEYFEKLKNRQSVTHTDLKCIYCNKECKSKISLAQHEIRCKNNPNKIISPFVVWNKINPKRWNAGLTKDTDERIAKGIKTFKERYAKGEYGSLWNKPHSEETKNKISKKMLEICAKQGKNNCGRGIRGYYKNIYCQSSWELAYVIYNIDHNIKFERNTKGFKYIIDGVERTYFPDFYLPDSDTFVEVKGYFDRKSKIKYDTFNGNIILMDRKGMAPVFEYVINKYGSDFIKLYDVRV